MVTSFVVGFAKIHSNFDAESNGRARHWPCKNAHPQCSIPLVKTFNKGETYYETASTFNR